MDANMEQARNDTRILLGSSWMVSGTDTYPIGYNWQETHWNTHKFRESDGTVETSSSPYDLCTGIHRFLFSERKITISYRTKYGSKPMRYAIPRDCRRRFWVLPPSERTQSGATPWHNFPRLPPEKASRGPRTQQHVSKHVEMRSRFCAQSLLVRRWWTSSSKTDPNCQRRLRHTSEGISWGNASRRWGTRPTSPCIHSQRTWHTRHETHVSHRPEQQAKLRDQQQSGAAQKQQRHHWPLHCACLVQLHTIYGTCLGPKYERKQEWLLALPRTPHWTGQMTSPISQPATRPVGTFHSAKLTTNRTLGMRMWTKHVIFRIRYVFFRNQIRVWFGKGTDTNQYFIARPAHFDVCAAGGWGEPCPQLLHELVPATQSLNFQQGQNFDQFGQLRIDNSGIIRDWILANKIFTITSNKWCPHDPSSLTLDFLIWQWIPAKMEHSALRYL